MNIIDVKEMESLSPVFKGERGNRFAKIVIKLLSIDRVNSLYDNSSKYSGSEFAGRLLNDLGVNYGIGNSEQLNFIPQGAFITVSNHPYGGLDGIMLIDLMAGIRPDYKLMVNRTLSLVRSMKDNFIPVQPVGNKKKRIDPVSLSGIRETLLSISNGHPVGFFPSGAVSDFSIKEHRVRDRKWQTTILNLIRSVKVPIVPIRFFDKNSLLFYFLGLIHWRIRLLRMPRELFNKNGRLQRIGIGKIISVKEQEQFKDSESFGIFLRKAVYEMPMPESFIPRKMIKGNERIKDVS
jgi:putative hemolysin